MFNLVRPGWRAGVRGVRSWQLRNGLVPFRRQSWARNYGNAPTGPAQIAVLEQILGSRLLQECAPEESKAWQERLQRARNTESDLTIVVDETCRGRELVQALLYDPIKTTPDEHATVATGATTTLERRMQQSRIRLLDLGADVKPAILPSSAVWLVTDDVRLLKDNAGIRALFELYHDHPHLLVVVNKLSIEHENEIRQKLSRQLRAMKYQREPALVVVDSMQATLAQSALQDAFTRATESDKALAISAFQSLWQESNFRALKEQMEQAHSSTQDSTDYLCSKTTEAVLYHLNSLHSEIDTVNSRLEAYSRFETAAIKDFVEAVQTSVIGPVSEDARTVRLELEDLMKRRLAWWKLLLGRVDDVSFELKNFLGLVWLRQTEKELDFQAGRFVGISQRLSESLDKFMQGLAPRHTAASAPFYSPVLENNVARQREISEPLVLADVLQGRRRQLISASGPVEALHRQAQGIMVSLYVALALSAGCLGYAAYEGWVRALPGVRRATDKGAPFPSPRTLTASSLLILALAAWRGQRRWLSSLKKLTANVKRVEAGLEHDIRQSVEHNLAQATRASRLAVTGVRTLMDERRSALVQVEALLKSS